LLLAGALVCAALLTPAVRAQAEDQGQIVWIRRPPTAQHPDERFLALTVTLRCTIRSGALTECAALPPVPPEGYAESAIAAAVQAQVAESDSRGAPVEGRSIEVAIGFPIPVAIDPPPAPPNPNIVVNPVWLEQPDARDFARNYPDAASAANVSGRATIDCLVAADGRLSCTVTAEDPPGYGFGEATLRISREFRLAPMTRDNVPTEGKRIRRTIRWVLPE